MIDFNPFLANVSILYPMKTPETQRFSGAYRGYKMEAAKYESRIDRVFF